MKKTLLAIMMTLSVAQANDMDKFFRALGEVESGNKATAYNKKENAIGIYQIRKLYFIDSAQPFNHKDCYNPKLARKVCEAYFKRYEPQAYYLGDFETLARLHNAGPAWAKKKHLTNKYWGKVKKALDSQ
jgi:hypothetical protein